MAPTLKGTLKLPGDKSISHRALIFSVLARGVCEVSGLSPAQDCASTIGCLRALGLEVDEGSAAPAGNQSGTMRITSPGLAGLDKPARELFAGNSGTTMRLLAGVAAGQRYRTTFDGDQSLRRRPMSRILDPLKQMGAGVEFHAQPGCAPFTVAGGALFGMSYVCPVASAQVQTALLLAGLQAEGRTVVAVPGAIRDHTLRMFRHIGVPHLVTADGAIAVERLSRPLDPFTITIPADLSSAAFFMVAAACLPGSEITLVDVGVNPGRRLVIDVLKAMGADVATVNKRNYCGEPVADLVIRGGERLNGVTISGAEVASGIDEIPILAVAGALCRGRFIVREAAELRVKESDRLKAIAVNLKAIGARITEQPDGFIIEGQSRLAGGSLWKTYKDHRLSMTGLVAGLICQDRVEIDDENCIAVSYPTFKSDLAALLR